MSPSSQLARFKRRVRLLRAWKGAAIGGCAGTLAAAVWAVLDLFRLEYASWLGLAAVAGGGAVLGVVVGFAWKLSDQSVAKSVDRRAGLKDRVSTSLANLQSSSLSDPQKTDAEASLSAVRPSTIYPVRLSRWHAGFLLAGMVASALFLLGNSPLLLTERQKKDRADLKHAAPAVEQIAKPLLETPNKTLEEKDLEQRLANYRAELQRGRIPKEQAMQQANDLAKQAQQLAQERSQKADQEMSTAGQAIAKMRAQALEKSGMTPQEASQFRSQAEAQEKEGNLQKQIQDLQKMLGEGKDAQGHPLTKQEIAALTQTLKQLEHQLELSQKASEFLRKLESQPEFKDLMKLMQQCKSLGKDPGSLTDEQIKQLNQMIEDLANKYKTQEEMRDLLKQMAQALKDGKMSQQMAMMAMALTALLSGESAQQYGHPGPGNGQELFLPIITRFLSQKSSDIKAKSIELGVTGDRQEGGSETFIELKGPSGLGDKTKVPYFKVLPKYRKEAERALARDQIPPEDQKRVKDYFDSLEGGK